MAINPETRYPGKIAPSTPEYPYGAARNITLPGDGTGTPWEAAIVNDLFGFQQALLSEAGLTPSGDADEVGASQYLEAVQFMGLTVKDDLTALRALTSTPPKKVWLSGHSSAGDGAYGSAFFEWDASSTASDNDGTIIKVTAITTGRYKLRYVGALNVKWFGAKGDGSTDDTISIQAALDYSATFAFGFRPAVYIPAGTYRTTGVAVPSYVTFFGDGDMSILELPNDVAAGTYSIVAVTEDGANSIVLRDFSIFGDNNNQINSPTVCGLDINTASPIIYSRFENLYIKECQSSALYIRGGGGADNCFFHNCMFRDSKGAANVFIESADKLDFLQCRIRSGKVGAGHGVLCDNAGNLRITFNGCRIEDNKGIGILSSNTSDQFNIVGCQIVANGGGGVHLDRCADSLVVGNLIGDNGNLTTTPQVLLTDEGNCTVSSNTIKGGAGKSIEVSNSDDSIVQGNNISGGVNTEPAISVDVSDGVLISGNNITDKQGNGIYVNNSNYLSINNNIFRNIGINADDTYAGILIDNNSDNNVIQLNAVSTTNVNRHKYGVWLANVNVGQNMVTNNSLIGYGTAGLFDQGTGTVTAAGNRV